MKVVHHYRGLSASACRGLINELRILQALAEGQYGPAQFLLQPYLGHDKWAWLSSMGYMHILTEYCPGGDLNAYRGQLTSPHLLLCCS
ncbi:hypothetical protein A0H81_03209 [Grifola frondosa]|uniref:Protein kinase domain-containing protein n=1 Tax=Grifola frondosa TaxID=5627 RepID=A0A1C7MIX4_GRIFR|nr:hypothetical protein A0H81_03209 [Grifola frondosa]